ncbi:histone deacetylase 11 isoform X3 [Nelusetta ayraudi]|uniref:histone deacetylase 11 isoform X3 n=1 Tax=Nelusetta ayraudi TaxID=303726 RepID=UPI003F6F5D42
MSHKEDNEGKGSAHRSELLADIPRRFVPIVYHPDYNISFMGLEKLHPFDAGKWGKVIHFLREEKFITDGSIVEAREATEEDLLVVHTKRYLNRLKWSLVVATITEIPPLIFLPNFLVQRRVLRPLRTQTGGTIMAGKLAVDRGWAINEEVSITAPATGEAASVLMQTSRWPSSSCLSEWQASPGPPSLIWTLIRGTDTSETSSTTSGSSSWTCIIATSTPGTAMPKVTIKRKVELDWGTEDSEYLQKVELHSEGTLNEVRPDIIVYNAGTDVLDGDPLGGLSISPQGIIKRDEIVFRAARRRGIPILMVTSGGYQKKTARIIADSILNLHRQGLIGSEALEGEGSSSSLVTSMTCGAGSAGSKFTAV